MNLTVVTPTNTIFSDTIEELVVNTTSGQIGILPGHMSLVTSLQPGEMIIKKNGNNIQHFAITGGFIEVANDKIVVLSDYAIQSEEIELEKVVEAKKRAEETLKEAKEGISERDFATAEAELRKAVLQLKIANKRQPRTHRPQ
jgi:F-type H+-transporting ATPase subunit epsilon